MIDYEFAAIQTLAANFLASYYCRFFTKLMDFTSLISNDSQEFIAVGNFKRFKFPAILTTCFFLAGLIQLFLSGNKLNSKQILPEIFISVMFFGTALFFWSKVLDKRIKLIINKQGIISNKLGLISWDDVKYFYIKEIFFKGRNYYFLILNTSIGEDRKIELSYLDKSYDRVKKAIQDNNKNNSIIDLGFETTN